MTNSNLPFAPSSLKKILPPLQECDNPAWWFNYLIPYEQKEKFPKFKHKIIKDDFNDALLQALMERREQILTALGREYLIASARYKQISLAMVGMGSGHVAENNLMLHYIYGVPYLPGSALKGIARSWAIAEDYGSSEAEALNNTEFKEIFGDQKQKGRVLFLDAYPEKYTKNTFCSDIMTPHYSEYYRQCKAPTDDQDPNPISFAGVQNLTFRVSLAIQKKSKILAADKLLEQAFQWLSAALVMQGIGAKTAVGYGRFMEVY